MRMLGLQVGLVSHRLPRWCMIGRSTWALSSLIRSSIAQYCDIPRVSLRRSRKQRVLACDHRESCK